MNIWSRALIVLCFVAIVSLHLAPVAAEDTEFTVLMRANYDFNILGDTPLRKDKEDTGYLPFAAVGEVTFGLDLKSLNEPAVTTIPFTDFTGQLQGTAPSPANLLPHFITPSVEFVGGQLNIERDKDGDILSLEVDNLQARWKMVGQDGSEIAGLELVTGGNAFDPNSNLPFFGAVSAVPFALGDVIKGPDVVDPNLGDEAFEVFLDGFPTPVVLGRARTLTVIIPEPGSLTMSFMLVAGFAVLCGRRRA